MFSKGGNILNNKPFEIEIKEMDKNYPLGKDIIFEVGDKLEIVETE